MSIKPKIWYENYPRTKTKEELQGKMLLLDAVPPTQATVKGMWDVFLHVYERQNGNLHKISKVQVLCTTRDISAMCDIVPDFFTFKPSEKNPQWSDVAKYEDEQNGTVQE